MRPQEVKQVIADLGLKYPTTQDELLMQVAAEVVHLRRRVQALECDAQQKSVGSRFKNFIARTATTARTRA
jgi:hypothetical protein